MSYAFTPIAVDFGNVKNFIGSKDMELVDYVVCCFAYEVEQIDRMSAEYMEDCEDEAAITVHGALTQMVNGAKYDMEPRSVYGKALQFVCQHLGVLLSNAEWNAMRTTWIEVVDEGLATAGVPETVFRVENHLLGRGSPIDIPEYFDLPSISIGYLVLDEIRLVQESFSQADFSVVNDEEVMGSIKGVQEWLQICCDSNCDLICFYQ